jgi:hypothetical protein
MFLNLHCISVGPISILYMTNNVNLVKSDFKLKIYYINACVNYWIIDCISSAFNSAQTHIHFKICRFKSSVYSVF